MKVRATAGRPSPRPLPEYRERRKFLAVVELFCAILLLNIFSVARADDLLAHASNDTLWVAATRTVTPDFRGGAGGTRTEIRYRSLGGDATWRPLPELTGRAIDLASRGATLAVLMDNGSWLTAWPGGFASGPALPGGAKALAIANDRDAIYAVALTGPEPTPPPSATAPATTTSPARDVASSADRNGDGRSSVPAAPATESTRRATESTLRAADDRLALFSFDGATWTRLADLPAEVPVQPTELALGVTDAGPTIAVPADGEGARVFQFGADHRWANRGLVRLPFPVRMLTVLPASPRTILWAAGAGGPGSLATFNGERWGEPKPLDLPRELPNDTPRAVTAAAGHVRLYFAGVAEPGAGAKARAAEAGRIYEQCYGFDGVRSGELLSLQSPVPLVPNAYTDYFTMAAMTALVVLMFATVRRRATDPPVARGGETPSVLAPLRLRLAAGLIDLLPLIVTFFVLAARSTEPLSNFNVPALPMLVALAVYLLHTLITELATGRTIGKMVMGLRVVSIDGSRAGPGAIVVRNVMRLIDLIPPLLVLIVVSPLRQRMGDVLSRTLVVLAAPEETSGDETGDDTVQRKPRSDARRGTGGGDDDDDDDDDKADNDRSSR